MQLAAEGVAGGLRCACADERVKDPLLGGKLGLGLDVLAPAALHESDGDFDEIAHDLLDVATDVADFGELRRLDLQKRRARQSGEAARDLGLAAAGRPDHQNVLRHHLFAHRRDEPEAAPAVAQSDRDGALGLVLADDIAVKLGNDFARTEIAHFRAGFR